MSSMSAMDHASRSGSHSSALRSLPPGSSSGSSRSRWFAVDAIGGAVAAPVSVAMFAALSGRKLEIANTMDWPDAIPLIARADTLLRGLVIAGVAILLGAVMTAVARGRTDRERVHRALSFTLWPALTAVALFGLAFAHWGIQ